MNHQESSALREIQDTSFSIENLKATQIATADQMFGILGYTRLRRKNKSIIRYKNNYTGAEIFVHDNKVYKHKAGHHTHFTFNEIKAVSTILGIDWM